MKAEFLKGMQVIDFSLMRTGRIKKVGFNKSRKWVVIDWVNQKNDSVDYYDLDFRQNHAELYTA